MGFIALGFLIPLIIYLRESHRTHDYSDMVEGIMVCVIVAALMSLLALFTPMNLPYTVYEYEPERIELTKVDGIYIAVGEEYTRYVSNYEFGEIKNKDAAIHTSNKAYANYMHYRGFNKENVWRWLYSFPTGNDRIEFYVPEDGIAFRYTLGGAK